MVRERDDEWDHKSGSLGEYDGGHITYEHPSGLEAYCEAMVEEMEGRLEYRPTVLAPDGMFLEYPDIFYEDQRDDALDQLHEYMDEYPKDEQEVEQ